MEQPQQGLTFSMGIGRIKDLEFFIDESAEVDNELTSQVTFNNTLNIYLETERIDIIIEANFYVNDIKDTFMRGKVLTSFNIPNMKQYLVPDTTQVNIPDAVLVTMFSIAITHTRALIAKASMGSRFGNLYLPIIPNPGEILKQMLPHK